MRIEDRGALTTHTNVAFTASDSDLKHWWGQMGEQTERGGIDWVTFVQGIKLSKELILNYKFAAL